MLDLHGHLHAIAVVSTIIRLSLQPNSTLTIINIAMVKRCTLYEAIKSHAEKNFPVGCVK